MSARGTSASGGLSAAWMMVLATVLFAGMGLCVKKASDQVSTAEVVFFRGLVGALIMVALAAARQLPLRTSVPRQHLWRGVAGVSALSLWFYAIAHLPLATAVTLNYMSSVWMAVFLMLRQAWLRWRQQPHRQVPRGLVAAVVLGFVGVALVLRPTVQGDQWLDALAALLSGMLSAWAYLQVVSLGRSGEPEHRVVFYFSVFGTAVGLGLMASRYLVGHDALPHPTPEGWAWLLGIGLFATLAQLAMTRAYAQGQPLAMASLQYLGIVHAFVLGVWLLDEPLHLLSVAGGALIVLAGMAATRLAGKIRD